MEKKIVKMNDNDGNTVELKIIKEFMYKDKKYAVLYEASACGCGDECSCDDDCCDGCIYIFEVVKDEHDHDSYIEITDEKIMKEIVNVAEKEVYNE